MKLMCFFLRLFDAASVERRDLSLLSRKERSISASSSRKRTKFDELLFLFCFFWISNLISINGKDLKLGRRWSRVNLLIVQSKYRTKRSEREREKMRRKII